jgi:hypothetical protein
MKDSAGSRGSNIGQIVHYPEGYLGIPSINHTLLMPELHFVRGTTGCCRPGSCWDAIYGLAFKQSIQTIRTRKMDSGTSARNNRQLPFDSELDQCLIE